MKENQWGNVRELRFAAESLADAIKNRTAIESRIRNGQADAITGGSGYLTPKQLSSHPLVILARDDEERYRELLRSRYEQAVPAKVQEWAESIPIIRTGELFPRLAGIIGNPRRATPLRIEGTGRDRRNVPDGPEYDRSLRQLWQWCGCGDPDLEPVKGDQAILLRRGKVTQARPLLFTFSSHLVMGSGRSQDVRDSELYKLYVAEKEKAVGRRHYKTCRNKKVPPLKPNGCGIAAHPEWGEPGSPWRKGHINMHAHRMVQKELLRQFWRAAEGTC